MERSRPQMEAYGIHTEQEGLLSWRWAGEQLERSHNYWICTTRTDGRPHAMPVWGVWLEDTFYFGTAESSVKAGNLAANPALVVHVESGDECVILEGVAEHLLDPAEQLFDRIADAYADKYPGFRPDRPTGGGWFALRPQVVFAWRERDYPGSATRWRFNERA